MTHSLPLKAALKRGALIAAANWPLVLVQFVAEAMLKLLLAVPTIGGLLLVVLLLEADVDEVLSGSLPDIAAAIFNALGANPVALVAVAISFLIVLLGGSALTFVVKGGTITLLAAAEASAGTIERPPVRLDALRRLNRVHIDPFLDGCRRYWRRYLRLGGCLLIAYALTAIVYFGILLSGLALADGTAALLGWTLVAILAALPLAVWITLVNLAYVLTQMIVAVEDVSVRTAAGLVVQFVRGSLREIAAIFGIVLLLVAIAVVASFLAATGLGLIAFVPLAGLAVLPLQFAGWLVRGFVFQYLALTALGGYLSQYRLYARGATPLRGLAPDLPGQRSA